MSEGLRWGVVSTMSEPDPLALSFVAHHLEQGADEISIYLDTPAPALAARLTALPRVRVVERTSAYWLAQGFRWPPIPPERQRHNAQDAYRQSRVDWLLHIDADEFLIETQALLRHLGAVPPEIDFVRIRPIERVWLDGAPPQGIFDGVFRRVAARPKLPLLAEVYGDDLRFLDQGVSGNGKAKSIVRTGRDLRMGVHGPDEGGHVAQGTGWKVEGLLHFDGLTPAHLLAKLRRKMTQNAGGWQVHPSRARREQMAALAARWNDPQGLADLLRRLQTLSPRQAERLDEARLLRRVDFDPSPALRRWIPGPLPDLSVAHFDGLGLDELRVPPVRRALGMLRGAARRAGSGLRRGARS